MSQITIHLWFDNQAEEAANFYTSVFKDSKINQISRYGKAGKEVHGQKAGTVMAVNFQINGQDFIALNGGPLFKFNESISLLINCEDQVEVDYYWEKLSAHRENEQCGWLKDKFGLFWQVVPKGLHDLISDPTSEKSQRAMTAMLSMKKLDINELRRIYEGK